MGIIANAKAFIDDKVSRAGGAIGNAIASASVLSPKQLEDVEARRQAYWGILPNRDREKENSIVQKYLGAIGIEVYQEYLGKLESIYAPVDTQIEKFDEDNRIRYFDILKWVVDTEEKSLDKLVSVYQVLSEEDCNIALIYHRTVEGCKISVGVANTNVNRADPANADNYYSRLCDAIKGNFPGSDIRKNTSFEDDYGIGIPSSLHKLYNDKNNTAKSIAIVSNVASEKSESFISQSMEKLIDGIVPKNDSEEYTIVLLAKPIREQLQDKTRLFELYTALKPFETWQVSTGASENTTGGSSFNLGGNIGANISQTTGISAGFSAPTPAGFASTNISHSSTVGTNFGVSFQRSSSVSITLGKNESVSQTYTNFGVQHTLELIEAQLKRIEESFALGMWEFAAYIVSDSPVVAKNVAHMYLALTQGEQSYLTNATINFWDGDRNTTAARTILKSVQKLQHPVFGLKNSLDEDWMMYPTLVTPTTPLSGKELARALNFPRKSVSGIPVLSAVAFGREPHSLTENILDIEIGSGYHMRKKNESQRIFLSKEELTKHTFITGSTGSGKSNTIYKLLEKLEEQKVNYLVIEPAKGEYKDIVGKKGQVTIYVTNPNIKDYPLLRLNPFRFNSETHILEHLDRLIEIFNVCWPMYAAMPAILKDAVERAYVNSGWDLERSKNRYSSELFPTFTDVFREIRHVLQESDYSDDNKGDYTGSLVTRLKSLTNGINGLIFSVDDVKDEALFDRNVIIDLSRIGSSETKSLVMGVIVLKLHEYRMEQRRNISTKNESLKHVTILEEAHHLLKRTSTEQISEGANLMGKSVEMLSNSIAEMRTYGEGFIIADQAPGLLDRSVIRNTNTKIILRLPDLEDRILVGKASGLSDNQIEEVARLEKGVAVVSQSDWLEPVLCKIDEYKKNNSDSASPAMEMENDKIHSVIGSRCEENSLLGFLSSELYRKNDRVDIQSIKEIILRSKMDTGIKCEFFEYLSKQGSEGIDRLRSLIFDYFKADKAIKVAAKCENIDDWAHTTASNLHIDTNKFTKQQIDLLLAIILYEKSLRDSSYNEIFRAFTEVHRERGVVF